MPLSEQDVERLHQRRYRSFRHGAAAIVGDYEEAHDVVQEAFARALAVRGDFRGGSAEAWLQLAPATRADPDDRLFFSSPSFAGPGTERVLVGLRGRSGGAATSPARSPATSRGGVASADAR